MNRDVLVKLVSVVVMSMNILLISSPQGSKKPSIQVEWHITGVGMRFASIKDSEIRKENKERCVNFGLTDNKGYYGIAQIEAFYDDSKYSSIIKQNKLANNKKHDWVLLVPNNVINTNNLNLNRPDDFVSSIAQVMKCTIACFDNQSAQPQALRYNNPRFYKQIAQMLSYDEDFFNDATCRYAHPRYIPVGWIMDKKIGDKIQLQAHGYDIEVTIASLPKNDSDQMNLLTFLKAVSYGPIVAKSLLACYFLSVFIKYLKS